MRSSFHAEAGVLKPTPTPLCASILDGASLRIDGEILGASFLEGEAFHYWLLFLVVPTSVFSLWLGCRKHGRLDILTSGIFGVSLLLLIVLLGVDQLGEIGESMSTVAGAAIIALAHLRNLRACNHL